MHDYYATFSLLKLQRPAVWDMSSKFILAKLRYCIKSNAGVTAVEYGLIAAATAFATALGMVALGPRWPDYIRWLWKLSSIALPARVSYASPR